MTMFGRLFKSRIVPAAPTLKEDVGQLQAQVRELQAQVSELRAEIRRPKHYKLQERIMRISRQIKNTTKEVQCGHRKGRGAPYGALWLEGLQKAQSDINALFALSTAADTEKPVPEDWMADCADFELYLKICNKKWFKVAPEEGRWRVRAAAPFG